MTFNLAISAAAYRPNLSSLAGGVLDRVALNPQPLPPRETAINFGGRFEQVGLNPQPLPPRETAISFGGRFEQVGLNPQPLPPRESAAALRSTPMLPWLDHIGQAPGHRVMLAVMAGLAGK